MKLAASLGVALLLVSAAPLPAHDGHDEEVKVLSGTVTSVENDAIQVETLDQATMQLTIVRILIDEKTKFLEGKKRVKTLDLVTGQRVESMVKLEDASDGSHVLRALQVKVSPPKKSASRDSR